MSPPNPSAALKGRRFLVIEDEPLIMMLLDDMLSELGGVMTASAARLSDALALAQSADADMALLDLNLGGEKSFAVAEALAARGVPFVWISGTTEAIAGPHGRRPQLSKPFDMAHLREVLMMALA